MKKQLLIAGGVICTLMAASCGTAVTTETPEAKISRNDLSKERLNGNVKTIRQRVYWSQEKFGRIEKGRPQKLKSQDYLKEYDEDGFLAEETFFDLRDSVISRRKITYDKPGQIVKEEVYDGLKLSSVVNYTYENETLQQKETTDGEGKLKERYVYVYYESGLLMDEDKYNADNKLSQKTVRTYDDYNTLKEKQYYWGGGSLYKKESLQYYGESDQDAVLASVTTVKYENKKPIFDGHVAYDRYNQFGDYQQRTVFDKADIPTEVHEYSYDQFGNLTEYIVRKIVIHETVKTEETEDSEADESDDTVDVVETIAETEVNDDELSNTGSEWDYGTGDFYEYSFDEKNNWTRKITYKLTNVTDVAKESARQFYYDRTITYY
ncbi:MAG: hypothetical protein LBT48_08630 [Prevotellaceae bacterium]|jgi:hypothetical protein|nr:hypothetical protein [Prevotellaceae bacterium]